RDAEDQARLYQLIWNRFLACRMRPAVYDQTVIDVKAGRALLRATGQVLKFAGYTVVYEESQDETPASADSDDEAKEGTLPDVREGERLTAQDVLPEQHF